ncbi:MAG: phage tail tape measure protein [Candidatus Kariarchaeaceae archaeon]|jgi:TP901 family phage tail tape measure protein
MAFNINAQIILSQPKNLNNVSKQISKQLGKSTKIDLKIGNVQQLTNLNKQLTSLNSSLTKLNSNLSSTKGSVGALGNSFNNTARGVGNVAKAQGTLNTQVTRANQSLKTQGALVGTLGKRFGSVAKQAIAFGVISRPIYDLQRAFTGAVRDAVKFEREIVRISQVTGKSVQELGSLTDQINKLATSLGISANELAETSRVIAQAGIRGKDLEQVLNALARSTLAPTFGKITDTTEGLIAAFGQFGLKGKDAEAVLGSLNKVSKEFAVEAEDLISVIRRTGGVFAQAAGDSKGTVTALQELTAVFTAVRSTTRESADTIAAGLRTIFSRIQRRTTINFLKQFGVDLTDAQGKFVGIFPAFDQLSQRLDTLIKKGDALTLSAIAEELGGIRQIGKLLPAIAQFDKARKALTEAQKGAVEGLGGDVSKALDTIDKRVAKVRETFNQLIRTVFESNAFQNFSKNILQSAESFLKFGNDIVSALEPVLPILSTLGAFKLGRGLGSLLGGGIGGAVASATGSTAGAQAAQKTAAAVTSQTQLITNTNSILTRMSNQLNNIFQVNNSGFNQIAKAIATKPTGGIAGVGGRRRASGGVIPKFANGGRVYGPSHAGGGVIAELEGGEYVVPKKFAKGSPKTVRGNQPAKEITSRRPIGILFSTCKRDYEQKTYWYFI